MVANFREEPACREDLWWRGGGGFSRAGLTSPYPLLRGNLSFQPLCIKALISSYSCQFVNSSLLADILLDKILK